MAEIRPSSIMDIAARVNGFESAKDLASMVSQVNLADSKIEKMFKTWREIDGSKEGLTLVLKGDYNVSELR